MWTSVNTGCWRPGYELRSRRSNGYDYISILDFCKAFDKVPHQRLISKLQFYGIQGSTLASIKPWLTSWSLSVIVAGVCSKSVVVTSRVPQGTVLGPLMFLLFIVVFAVLLDSLLVTVGGFIELFSPSCYFFVTPCLGVLLFSDLRWNSHVDKIVKKGNSILYVCEKELVRLLRGNQTSSICITCQATSRVCDCSMGSL